MSVRKDGPQTSSGIPVQEFYEASAQRNAEPAPGEFPYTRGIHRSMYRGKLWTMRQYAGFGSARDTNARYHFLLKQGITGLSVAFDLPTQMGRDPDHAVARGEVGRVGVSIATLEDMQELLDGIPLADVSISMTINATAAILLGFLLVHAERLGVPWQALRGTIQNDILKEYIARGTYIYPPRPALRIVTDIFDFCAQKVPQWNTISISGYHIREAGSTAVQEVAFTLADGIAYVEAACARGLRVDDFAPRIAFFFNCHNNFFEEIAKFRAARRVWATLMRDRFKAQDPRSWMVRFHTQTAGSSLTAQQPHNNVVRTTVQALAAVLGGTQSLHTNGFDEALGLPTEESARLALRTQQILAYESGVADVADPLGGSYLIEEWTDQIERRVRTQLAEIEARGGMLAAIEQRYPQREIEDAAYEAQRSIERGESVVVGVNRFETEADESRPPPIQRVDLQVEQAQRQRVAAYRAQRDSTQSQASLRGLQGVAQGGGNLMEAVVACIRSSCTLGEIADVLRGEFGEYNGG